GVCGGWGAGGWWGWWGGGRELGAGGDGLRHSRHPGWPGRRAGVYASQSDGGDGRRWYHDGRRFTVRPGESLSRAWNRSRESCGGQMASAFRLHGGPVGSDRGRGSCCCRLAHRSSVQEGLVTIFVAGGSGTIGVPLVRRLIVDRQALSTTSSTTIPSASA